MGARLFSQFSQDMALFTRFGQDQTLRRQMLANQSRPAPRVLEVGETVFRKLPRAARINKHMANTIFNNSRKLRTSYFLNGGRRVMT